MESRLVLHEKLLALCPNVYFQPPASWQMTYPAIRYEEIVGLSRYADNDPYMLYKQYELSFIAQDPDSDVPDKLRKLRLCRHDRFYVADNLNHHVFTIYA